MLRKGMPFQLKGIEKGKREAVLAFATYNSMDRDEDIASQGMFTKSVKESFADIRMYLNHDPKQSPGRPMDIWEDNNHAYAKSYMGTHTLGEDTLKMMDEGIITDVSYGFDPIKAAPVKKNSKGRKFTEVKLWEYSPLTHWGAHPGSYVQSVVKSAEMGLMVKQLKEHMVNMEKFCRNTKASDICIQQVLKELDLAKSFISRYDTADTPEITEPSVSVDEEKEFANSLYLLTLKNFN
jgi:HK97 family phage prohead protease